MNAQRVAELTGRLQYSKPVQNGFRVTVKSGLVFLHHWQVHNDKTENGRKFYISEHMTDSEVLQTALLAVLTYEEHEAREALTFDGRRLYGPHRSLVNLEKEVELRDEEGKSEASEPVEATRSGLQPVRATSIRFEKSYPWLEQRRTSYDPYADDPYKF